jgi:hypothetical protein
MVAFSPFALINHQTLVDSAVMPLIVGFWGFGVLGFWGFGVLGFLGFGVVGCWGFGVLG